MGGTDGETGHAPDDDDTLRALAGGYGRGLADAVDVWSTRLGEPDSLGGYALVDPDAAEVYHGGFWLRPGLQESGVPIALAELLDRLDDVADALAAIVEAGAPPDAGRLAVLVEALMAARTAHAGLDRYYRWAAAR